MVGRVKIRVIDRLILHSNSNFHHQRSRSFIGIASRVRLWGIFIPSQPHFWLVSSTTPFKGLIKNVSITYCFFMSSLHARRAPGWRKRVLAIGHHFPPHLIPKNLELLENVELGDCKFSRQSPFLTQKRRGVTFLSSGIFALKLLSPPS